MNATTKKVSPQTTWNNKHIAKAQYFTAHLRVGPHEKYNAECATLDGARKAARDMEKEHSRYGRKALVYAVTNGLTFHIEDDYVPETQGA